MKRVVALLPVLIAFQAGAPPALAWTWPVDGPVLQTFSLGEDPYAAGQHRGVDVGAAAGSPVRAPAAGTVSFAGTVPGGGRTLTVRTEDGYSVTLVHLGGIAVARNARVAEGATVGTVGPSGEVEHPQPYVHLGVRVTDDPNGYLDPLGLLPSRELAPPPAPDPPEEHAPEEGPVTTPAPAPVVVPEPEAAPVPDTPLAVPAAPDEPLRTPAAAERTEGRARSASRSATAPVEGATQLIGGAPSTLRRAAEPAGAVAARRPDGSPASELAAHTIRRSFESIETVPLGGSSADASPGQGLPLDTAGEVSRGVAAESAALGATLAALAVVVAVALALRRRQLGDAGPAHAAAPVLLDTPCGAAEDAGRARPAEENRLVPHGDLEWIPLRKPEPLANLDRDDDPTQLIEVPDDACRRPATAVVAGARSHRARRHQSSRRRAERLPAR